MRVVSQALGVGFGATLDVVAYPVGQVRGGRKLVEDVIGYIEGGVVVLYRLPLLRGLREGIAGPCADLFDGEWFHYMYCSRFLFTDNDLSGLVDGALVAFVAGEAFEAAF